VMALSVGLRYFSGSFESFLILVALFGIGGPMISVGCPKTMAMWFRGKDRGTAVGIYMTGPWIGGAFALAATNGLLMPLTGHSWRMTFAVYGAMSLAVALLWWFAAKDLEAGRDSGGLGTRRLLATLLKVRNIRIVLLSGLLGFGIIHGLSSWLPKILESRGYSPTLAGYAASLPLLGGIPSLLILPRVVPANRRGLALGIIGLLAGVSVWLLFTISGLAMFGGLILYGVTSSALIPLLTLILMETPEVGPENMGTAGGLFFCIAEIGGFSCPLVVGTLVDWTGSFLTGGYFVAGLGVTILVLSLFIQDRSETS